MFFRTVPSAITLVRWVNENAFVLEVQTRPCPTFGRPVHHGFPLDYGPVFLLMPFGSHLTVDTLPSEVPPAVALALCFLRPARNYPRFWIWRPSFGCQRDLNPPGRRAAQHALRVLGFGLFQDLDIVGHVRESKWERRSSIAKIE